ncbi:MAG: secretin N-terminal domain-containing protein [Candidatus Omnitrophota bacterium]|nr:secretin N-terminal domain-containing protein [Candidatus Omnitrophota bacterium]
MAALKNKMRIFLALTIFLFLMPASSIKAMDGIPYSNLYRRISMDFKDANLKDVLKIFSQQAGLNFVAAEDVADTSLTLYLDNVTVKQAMDKLLTANKLIYDLDPESNIFIVKKSLAPEVKTITKVFYLKNARVPGSPLDAAIGGEGGSKGEILAVIQNLLSEYGKIVVESQTNSLIVTDIPERFTVIEDIIVKLDLPTPQIMIEVEMLDVNKSVSDDLGVRLTGSLQLKAGGPINTSFPFWGNELERGKTRGGTTASAFTYGTLSAPNLAAIFNFLTTQTDTKVLARPRIMTLNNQTAEIKIASNEAIGVTVTTDSAGNSSATPERVETGIVLTVTAQANTETGDINMFIYPKSSDVPTSSSFTSDGREFKYLNPEERSTKSVIKIKDGETILIGGLIRQSRKTEGNKIPFFSSIPLLGMFFRNKDRDTTERELLVFLTPRIIRDSKAMDNNFNLPQLTLDLNREQSLSGRELEIERLLKQHEIK